jgi:hypothetical protein
LRQGDLLSPFLVCGGYYGGFEPDVDCRFGSGQFDRVFNGIQGVRGFSCESFSFFLPLLASFSALFPTLTM